MSCSFSLISNVDLNLLFFREDEIKFEDLAYHNSTLYSSFCQMILDAKSPSISEEDFESTYCCNFEVFLRAIPYFAIFFSYRIRFL